MNTIGIVSEGPRDFDMLKAVINHLVGEECNCLAIQPDPLLGELGSGWKGVWKWCQKQRGNLAVYLNGVTPKIDMLVIQMDGDVARKEKEAYCHAVQVECGEQDREGLFTCLVAKRGQCPQQLPPNPACDGSVQSRAEYLRGRLLQELDMREELPVFVTVPCDSTDAWILAAYENEIAEPEKVDAPWETTIARSKDYHGVRIPGRTKSAIPYRKLVQYVCSNWENVVEKCSQAKEFELSVRTILNCTTEQE